MLFSYGAQIIEGFDRVKDVILMCLLCGVSLGLSAVEVASDKDKEEGNHRVEAQEETETMTILSTRTPRHFTELNTANSIISPEELVITPSNTLEMLTSVPGVAENGQAGLFQVYSIRGFSRQRVLTYVSDIPLKAERRAGVASSFFHPLLLDSAEVMRGPASTLYQSGSLGGVIKFKPKFFSGQSFSADYYSEGNRNSQIYGAGGEDWSFGLARQSANNSEDAIGDELNNGYDQYSMSLIKHWRLSDVEYEWLTIASNGDDIGRSSLRYPDRLVTVPNESHLLSQLSVQTNDWRFSVYAHPNEVETLTVRPGNRENFVSNDSNDFGLHFESTWEAGSLEGIVGADGFSRSSIDASDFETSLVDNTSVRVTSLNGATEREFGLFATLNSYVGNTKWQLGARAISNYQNNSGEDSIDDNAFTGFLGVSHPINNYWLWTANLGTGVRFATVSERFYTGTTGRGAVVGNPDLQKERSVSLDTGVKYSDSDKYIAFNIYRQKLHDYIERIEIAPELLSYRNIANGTIDGLEVETRFKVTSQLDISANAMYVNGQDFAGNTLADIPASRVDMSSHYKLEQWQINVGLEYRKHKSDISTGEKETPSAWIGQVSVDYEFSRDTKVGIFVDNLFDEEYFTSADDIVPYAEGRGFGLTFRKYW